MARGPWVAHPCYTFTDVIIFLALSDVNCRLSRIRTGKFSVSPSTVTPNLTRVASTGKQLEPSS